MKYSSHPRMTKAQCFDPHWQLCLVCPCNLMALCLKGLQDLIQSSSWPWWGKQGKQGKQEGKGDLAKQVHISRKIPHGASCVIQMTTSKIRFKISGLNGIEPYTGNSKRIWRSKMQASRPHSPTTNLSGALAHSQTQHFQVKYWQGNTLISQQSPAADDIGEVIASTISFILFQPKDMATCWEFSKLLHHLFSSF